MSHMPILLAVVAAYVGSMHGPEDAQAPTSAASDSTPASIQGPGAAAHARTRLYRIERGPAHGLRATSAAQNLRAGFTPGGISVRPHEFSEGDSFTWSLSLVRAGRAGSLAPVRRAALVAAGNRVEYRRGLVTEWYVNRPKGIEQGFSVARRPAGEKIRPFVLELASAGALQPRLNGQGTAVELRGSGTSPVLRYSGLHAFDSKGTALPSHMRVEGRTISLVVDDSDATYPLTVDPTISRPALHPPGLREFDTYGTSVAISGSTAVVGASLDDNAAGTDAGAAWVFVRSGGAWTLQATLTAADASSDDRFGSAVAISGKRSSSAHRSTTTSRASTPELRTSSNARAELGSRCESSPSGTREEATTASGPPSRSRAVSPSSACPWTTPPFCRGRVRRSSSSGA